ncbi:MAG: GAF domain-containing protein [Anaerolineaceae bacterium]|nr:GAF domain-containing protein [Anaerolineaceae bacterium]
MATFLRSLFAADYYETPDQRQQARAILLITGTGVVSTSIYLLLAFSVLPSVAAAGVILLIVSYFISYFLVRSNYLNIAKWLVPISSAIAMFLVGTANDESLLIVLIVSGIPILMGGLLAQVRGMIVLGALTGFLLFIDLALTDNLTTFYITTLLMAMVSYTGITNSWGLYALATLEAGQKSELFERTRLSDVTAKIIRGITATKTKEEILHQAVHTILEHYDEYYHVQVFLLEPDGITTQLVASTGEVGQKLLKRKHSLAVGSVSVVGQTMLQKSPQVTYANVDHTIMRPNELLPETTIEAAFPLRIGGDVVGVLDLQSKKRLELGDYEMNAFQSLADSLALAISNLSQIEMVQKQVAEKQLLAEQARTALREVERLNKRIIGRAWADYLSESHTEGIDYSADADNSTTASDWTSTLAEAAQNNTIVHQDAVIAVPLAVRGQVIGAMEFELTPEYSITPEDLELIQEIGQGFSLAAENIRLLDDSQRNAQREAVINEIGSRLQGNNVESTLAEAARSLYTALHAARVTVRLGIPDELQGASTEAEVVS